MTQSTLERTPRFKAERLLSVHDGRCSIPKDHHLAEVFQSMQREGLVDIAPEMDVHSNMMNVYRKEIK